MKKKIKFQIGLRTIKTAVAVILAMLLVDRLGTTSSKLIFAMLGAMAAVQPNFKSSLESCLTQIVGVMFGAVMGVLLASMNLHPLAAAGIGIVLVITLYNAFHISYSPSLPCFIVVMICTTPDVQPFTYALGRIWDTTIGLAVGMLINTLVFPYDNSSKIRAVAESLDVEVIEFLEDLFDGNIDMPGVDGMSRKIDEMASQLKIFSNQKLVLNRKRQRDQLESFRICERKARELVARMEVLSHMESPGRLNEQNRSDLIACGAAICDDLPSEPETEIDIVMNYHVRQILRLRNELLEALKGR